MQILNGFILILILAAYGRDDNRIKQTNLHEFHLITRSSAPNAGPMKQFTGESEFGYKWRDLVCAYWQRYPNAFSRHVLSDDVMDRKIVNGCLRSVRILLKTTAKPPKWGEMFVNARSVAVIEEAIVDVKAQTLTTYTHNVGPYKKILNVEERCVFKQNEDNSNMSTLYRQAWVTSSIRGFGGMIERFGLERFKNHAKGANKGFSMVLQKFFPSPSCVKENVTCKRDNHSLKKVHSPVVNVY